MSRDFELDYDWYLMEYFTKRLDIGSDGCWQWTGTNQYGYGIISIGAKSRIRMMAHRFSYEIFKGKVPEDLVLDHLCRNRRCVNPDHLEAVTTRENILRGIGVTAQSARKTHCIRGHELVGANLYKRPDRPVDRACKTCRRSAYKRHMNKVRMEKMF